MPVIYGYDEKLKKVKRIRYLFNVSRANTVLTEDKSSISVPMWSDSLLLITLAPGSTMKSSDLCGNLHSDAHIHTHTQTHTYN